uniref:Pentacotripeptide-repeat region of PRORP domain-containing protein n=1 Tax=Leersia perrieri TaxID=77586 RepID=A0A0D9X9E0_9ORYZ
MAPPPHLLPLLLGRLVVSGDLRRRSTTRLRRIIPLLPAHPHLAALLCEVHFPLFPYSSATFLHNILIRAAASGSPCISFAAFSSLLRRGILPDRFTFPPLLGVAARMSGFPRTGAQVHAQVVRRGFMAEVFVVNALLAMYATMRDTDSMREVFGDSCAGGVADVVSWNTVMGGCVKCGEMGDARRVFDEMPERNGVSWSTMAGCYEETLELFRAMQTEGIVWPNQVTMMHLRSGEKLNDITFVGVLTACAHGGLVDEGRQCFQSMASTCGVQPEVKHYGCMVDMLGRAGLLEEAEELIWSMPMAPDIMVLGTLLGACRMHKRFDVAKRVQGEILSLNAKKSGCQVMISDIYAAAGKWVDALEARQVLQRSGIRNLPRSSSSTHDNRFLAEA